jgi:hemerythrin-like domain-containing protein
VATTQTEREQTKLALRILELRRVYSFDSRLEQVENQSQGQSEVRRRRSLIAAGAELTERSAAVDPHTLAQQTMLEHQILKHLTNALEVSLNWDADGIDGSRKLASVRFVMQSLQRHLERQLALEEFDGYMEAVLESHPSLSGQIEKLKHEHDEFRSETYRIVSRLDSMTPTDGTNFEATCGEIRQLLVKLAEHSRKEVNLLQDSFLQEEVGLD